MAALMRVLVPLVPTPKLIKSSPPRLRLPWLIQVLPPVSCSELPLGMLMVEVPWVMRVPLPVMVASPPVALKAPETVTLPLLPKVPPVRVSEGRD